MTERFTGKNRISVRRKEITTEATEEWQLIHAVLTRLNKKSIRKRKCNKVRLQSQYPQSCFTSRILKKYDKGSDCFTDLYLCTHATELYCHMSLQEQPSLLTGWSAEAVFRKIRDCTSSGARETASPQQIAGQEVTAAPLFPLKALQDLHLHKTKSLPDSHFSDHCCRPLMSFLRVSHLASCMLSCHVFNQLEATWLW